jgi:anthranilate synthase/aminodeoxychorismate synthase-like glutamine amidotransferase
MILLIDNYDSFVHNLARYFRRLGQETRVIRNDAIRVDEVRRLPVDALVFSPGPKSPQEAGRSLELVRGLHDQIPMLGVCLGHQTIAAALGASIVRAREPMHGRTSEIWHRSEGLFAGLPNPLCVARYHSLVVDPATLPPELVPMAFTADGTLMAVEHRHRPIVGWQFHPESILTTHGYALLAAFLRRIGRDPGDHLPSLQDEGPTDVPRVAR